MADQETEQKTTESVEQVASTEREATPEAVQEQTAVEETPPEGRDVTADGNVASAEENVDKSEPHENTEASPVPEAASAETPATETVKTDEQVGEGNATGEVQGDPSQSAEPEAKTDAETTPDATPSPTEGASVGGIPPSNLDFAKGEDLAEESPVIIQPMSRPDTPPLPVEGDLPVPGTPEKPGSVVEEEELLLVEEEIVPQYNREDLMQKYQAAIQERETLNQQNRALQHKLSEYFRKKKNEEARQEVDKNATDQEQRYMKYMSNLEELRHQQAAELDNYHEQLEEIKEKKAEKQGRVEEEWSKAMEFKKAVALAAINSRSGRPIPLKDLETYEVNERKKEAEVSHVRLENIKLKNRLKKQEMQLKQKEELAEGLHLIDFEQLKIENQTYNEKIEERNEELLKLRKKITSTVQVLTHLKEKLQFVQAENHVGKDQLGDVEQEVAQKRDILSRTKQARDALRHENNKFQQRCGLLGNTDLLRDFEVSTDEVDDLEHRLDMLKRTHAELTLSLNGVKRKIELAKENQS